MIYNTLMNKEELDNIIALLEDLMFVKSYSRYDIEFSLGTAERLPIGHRASEAQESFDVMRKGFKAFDKQDNSVFSFSYNPYMDAMDQYYAEFHWESMVVEGADFDIIQYLIRRNE